MPAQSPRLTVLYIEDSPMNVKLMEQIFAHRFPDFALMIAIDGESGLAMVAEADPALVLLDYHLPGISGLEVLQTIRAAGDPVPVIVVTADARPELAEAMVNAGAQAIVTKPFDFATFLDQVRLHLPATSHVS